jgi:putative PEP-CTERM system histidine kinase
MPWSAVLLGWLNGIGFGLGALTCLVVSAMLGGRRSGTDRTRPALVSATALTGGWALAVALAGPDSWAATLGESLRNLGWLAAIYMYFASDGRHHSLRPVRLLVGVLALIEAMQPLLLALPEAREAAPGEAVQQIGTLLRLLFTVGGLVLVHNLYSGAAVQSQRLLRWPALAFAAMWAIDLNFHALAYLSQSTPEVLGALRGFGAAAFAALIAIGVRPGSEELRFRPSRSIAFQSISLLLIGAYLVGITALARWLDLAGGDLSGRFQIAFVAAATALALITLPSRRIRGWLRVTLAKHLFQHRYDYREEWLRFTRTISAGGTARAPLETRVVKAMADITDSPAGLLLAPADSGGFGLAARWDWPTADVPAESLSGTAVAAFERDGFIVDLDEQRTLGSAARPGLPDWALADPRAWALVPLLHFDRLVGMVVLARPPHGRRLDWEDFDLLRVAGQQLASYLAEHSGQEALAEAGRFDDFNRRIAFVMHDIKNLASQLGLLARNAEIHADNPEFRADMLVTLRNAADKLNTLLARLSRYGASNGDTPAVLRADLLAAQVVERFRAVHAVELVRGEECEVIASSEPFEQALTHLVQNAIDASPNGAPVFVSVTTDAMTGIIEVVDSGAGMSPEFVRSKLFKPFVSTKQGGFGIGAYEARELIRAISGRLDVESREGLGSRFVIRLPLAATSALLENIARQDQRVA